MITRTKVLLIGGVKPCSANQNVCVSLSAVCAVKDGLILIRGVIHYDGNLRLFVSAMRTRCIVECGTHFTRSLRTVCMLSLDAGIVSCGTPENGVPKVILTVGMAFLGTQ